MSLTVSILAFLRLVFAFYDVFVFLEVALRLTGVCEICAGGEGGERG